MPLFFYIMCFLSHNVRTVWFKAHTRNLLYFYYTIFATKQQINNNIAAILRKHYFIESRINISKRIMPRGPSILWTHASRKLRYITVKWKGTMRLFVYNFLHYSTVHVCAVSPLSSSRFTYKFRNCFVHNNESHRVYAQIEPTMLFLY